MCRDFRHTAEDGKDYQTRFYRIVQDRLFESDFDRHIKKALKGGEKTP